MIAIILWFQTPIEEEPDFATLRFHAGPPYEVCYSVKFFRFVYV